MQWTQQQTQAIEARGGSVLVSAAAGSGKTAVLVERVLRRLCDPDAPCNADQLLIVTFTRAAAAQMRERIDLALERQLRVQPDNRRLLRQKQLLPLAEICTIDSFCMRLVKEHAALLGLPPEVRMLDQSESLLLRAQAAEETLEAAYKLDELAFQQLGLLLEVSGDDRQLIRLMQQAAELALASPHPDHWLTGLTKHYQVSVLPQESHWGQTQLDEARQRVDYARTLIASCLHDLEEGPALRAKYAPAFTSDIAWCDLISARLGAGDWDALRGLALSFARLGAKPKGGDEMLAELCKARRDKVKDILKAIPALFCVSAAEHAEDIAALAPVAEAFVALVRDYIVRCAALKSRRQAADFNDNLHWALQLLADDDGNRTAFARELGRQYAEILVDEYQDINSAQELLFQAISNEGQNLFLVGDVKQSIYRFRQANPMLFLEKRRRFAPYGEGYPAYILLGRNFRSRPGVTDSVNFVFRQLMRQDAAEIEYTAEEELVCGKEYKPELKPDAELHLLSYGDEDAAQAEAAYIASWIADEILLHGRQPREFCILLRSDHKPGAVFAQALRDAGVEAFAMESESLFQSREIQLLLSLLRVIDNPVQDIPLASVLLSPVIGCTPDDLARLRREHPSAPNLYHCLREEAELPEPNALIPDFLARLAGWRRQAAALAPGDLLRHVLDEAALPEITGVMRHAPRRRANLHRLEEYAAEFSNRPGASLSGFLRYMDRLEADQSLTAVNVISETANVVRVMSIHKSKGLEFPVCILAMCGKKFNLGDAMPPLLLHSEVGLGLQRPDAVNRARLPTLPHMALKTALRRSTLSEELRLLYVAMTRAKERLVLLCGAKDMPKRLQSLAGQMTGGTRLSSAQLLGANSFADWLITALLRHPDAHALRQAAGQGIAPLPAKERVRFVLADACPDKQPLLNDSAALQALPGDALMQEIEQRLSYQYPIAALTKLAAKRAVSELTEQAQQEAFAFSGRPAFLRKESISAAQRGTAMHAFLQFADFQLAAVHLETEIERLRQMGYLTLRDIQALEREKLEQFFASNFCARMLRCQKPLLREKKFTLRVPAEEFLEDPTTKGESIVVQGIIDCAFEEDGKLILLDYKTDRVEALSVLRERYAQQLDMYRRAMRECFGMEVAQTLIYSFWLGDWAEIEDPDMKKLET